MMDISKGEVGKTNKRNIPEIINKLIICINKYKAYQELLVKLRTKHSRNNPSLAKARCGAGPRAYPASWGAGLCDALKQDVAVPHIDRKSIFARNCGTLVNADRSGRGYTYNATAGS